MDAPHALHGLRHDRARRGRPRRRARASSTATRQWSFRELPSRVDALAGGLAGLGIGRGDRVCILAQNDPAYLELYGACARQGIVAYPINWRLTADGGRAGASSGRRPRCSWPTPPRSPVVGGWPGTQARRRPLVSARRGAPRRLHAARARSTETARRRRPDVAADDAFAVISTAAVDVIPRGAALTHANVLAANLTAHRRPRLHAGRPLPGRAAAVPHHRARHRARPPARRRAPAWSCRATTPRRRCG